MMSNETIGQTPALLLIDKPLGLSSNQCLQKVKRLLNIKKAGHTGSLDPLATGMLAICLNQATKFAEYFLLADKTYEVSAQLGVTTTTGDAEGEIVTKQIPEVHSDKLKQVINQFLGHIEQVPPMYSALKYQGQPLYRLARKGQTIERPARQVQIHELSHVTLNNDVLSMRVSCSKGTYIRSLMMDIGEKLGCGAHVTQLRRVALGAFHEQQMLSLDDLLPSQNLPLRGYIELSAALAQYPSVSLTQQQSIDLKHGKVIEIAESIAQGLVQLYDANHFMGLGIIEGIYCKVKRLMANPSGAHHA